MPRIGRPTLHMLAGMLGVAFATTLWGATPSERLLPDWAKGFFAISDVQVLANRVNNTQVGQLAQDPAMKPFVDDLRRQFEDRLSGFQEKLGLTLQDLEDVPGGELAGAVLLLPAEGGAETVGDDATRAAGVVLLVDITGHQDQAKSLLAKVSKTLGGEGAKKTEIELLGVPVTHFDLPPPKDGSATPFLFGQRLEDASKPRKRQALYCIQKNLLIASDQARVVEEVLSRVAGKAEGSLADHKAFQAVMKRCTADAGNTQPQIRWFIDPFGYADVVWQVTPKQLLAGIEFQIRNPPDKLREAGFTAVQGVGGLVDVAPDGYELVHRTFVYAPNAEQFEKSAKILSFPNHAEFAPQPWVPRDIASYATAYCDILNAFDNLGPLFDEFVGDGEKGTWEKYLDDLKTRGVKIDLREELIRHLGQRVTAISTYQQPITPKSERMLFAVEVEDEKAVAAALEKFFRIDVQRGLVRRVEYKGRVIWEVIEAEPAGAPRFDLNVSGVPDAEVPSDDDEGEVPIEEEGMGFLPNASITVAHGNLFVASHLAFLKDILELPEPRETLARNPEFLRVDDTIATHGGAMSSLLMVVKNLEKLGLAKRSAQSFSRTDEAYRPTYELIRQGKMPESETMFGRLLNTLFAAEGKKTLREQRIDGSKLPDFEVVRRHLGPAGMFSSTEAEGWFMKGFALEKK